MSKQNISCKICGFFVENHTYIDDPENENIGYCLSKDDKDKKGESFKIPADEIKNIAINCKDYYRKVPALSQGDFINWRVGHQIYESQKKLQWIIAITGVAITIIITVLQYYFKP